jgi:hypothetical protein
MEYRLHLDHTRVTQNANRILTDTQLRVTACEEQAHLKTIRSFATGFQYRSDLLSGFPEFVPLPWPTAGGQPEKGRPENGQKSAVRRRSAARTKVRKSLTCPWPFLES